MEGITIKSTICMLFSARSPFSLSRSLTFTKTGAHHITHRDITRVPGKNFLVCLCVFFCSSHDQYQPTQTGHCTVAHTRTRTHISICRIYIYKYTLDTRSHSQLVQWVRAYMVCIALSLSLSALLCLYVQWMWRSCFWKSSY